MALVNTGYEPSGDNWQMTAEKVFDRAPAGTPAQAGYFDAGGPYILGWDLWGAISIDQVQQIAAQKGMHVYYISIWRDPPAVVGFDTYRAIFVFKAGTGG